VVAAAQPAEQVLDIIEHARTIGSSPDEALTMR